MALDPFATRLTSIIGVKLVGGYGTGEQIVAAKLIVAFSKRNIWLIPRLLA